VIAVDAPFRAHHLARALSVIRVPSTAPRFQRPPRRRARAEAFRVFGTLPTTDSHRLAAFDGPSRYRERTGASRAEARASPASARAHRALDPKHDVFDSSEAPRKKRQRAFARISRRVDAPAHDDALSLPHTRD
jgi:hypothetical protein